MNPAPALASTPIGLDRLVRPAERPSPARRPADTFLRAGQPISSQLLRVNQPGSFGGYLVHGWTYGPAVRLHVTTLGGRVLRFDRPAGELGRLRGILDDALR